MRNRARGGLVVWSGGVRQARIGRAANDRMAALFYVLERLEARVLLSAGDLDTTFGTGGKVLTSLTGGFDAATSAIVMSDGKAVVGGRVTPPDGGGAWVALARYNTDGSLDTTFGDGGTTIVEQDAAGTGYLNIALDGDGDILVGTDLYRQGQMSDFGLFRFSSDGALDTSFGDDGVVRTDVSTWDIPESLAVRADGKIVVGGWARAIGYGVDSNGRSNDKSEGVVIRYNSDGTLDSGFGDGGVVEIGPAADMDWVMGRTVLAPDGNVLFAGNTSNIVTQDGHAILRLVADDGSITSLAFGNSGDDQLKGVKDVKIDAQGRIVLLLDSHDGAFLARFNSDGSADDTFGSAGMESIDSLNYDATLRIAGDGSILVAGQEGGAEGVFSVAHYLSDGSVDTAFGSGGVVATAFGSGHGEDIAGVAFSDDGKMVAFGGNGDNSAHESKFLIARYDAGDWGGSGEYVDGQVVEGWRSAGGSGMDGGGGDGGSAGGSGTESGGGGGSLEQVSGGSLVAPGNSPFSFSPAGADQTIFGKDEDLLATSSELF